MRGFYADSVLLVVHCCKTLKTHSVAAELGLRILLTFYSWVSSTCHYSFLMVPKVLRMFHWLVLELQAGTNFPV